MNRNTPSTASSGRFPDTGVAIAAALLALLLVGCNEGPGGGVGDGDGVAGGDGVAAGGGGGCREPNPDYGPSSKFDYAPDGPVPTEECAEACGPSAWPAWASYPAIDVALPHGACANATPTCRVTARVPCAGPVGLGPIHAFVCACESGVWVCRIRIHGAAACPRAADGGA